MRPLDLPKQGLGGYVPSSLWSCFFSPSSCLSVSTIIRLSVSASKAGIVVIGTAFIAASVWSDVFT